MSGNSYGKMQSKKRWTLRQLVKRESEVATNYFRGIDRAAATAASNDSPAACRSRM